MSNDVLGEEDHGRRVAGQQPAASIVARTRRGAARKSAPVATLVPAIGGKEDVRAFAFPPAPTGFGDHRIEKSDSPASIQPHADEPVVDAVPDRQDGIKPLRSHRR